MISRSLRVGSDYLVKFQPVKTKEILNEAASLVRRFYMGTKVLKDSFPQ